MANIGKFREICKNKGVRLTPQRLALYEEMQADKSHPSAEELYERIRSKMPTVSLDTIYRTLATFERCGVVTRLQIPGERSRFDADPSPHHHLVCNRCKNIADIHWPDFDVMELPEDVQKWGRVDGRHAEVRGTCRSCMEST